MKILMTGNEAIARGAWEAGVVYASAYPGTPSTEIMENLAKYDEICAEWAPNEKVALESAIGASTAGVRSMSSMKHVGVNVAADPLMTFAYRGVNGGSVIVSADDPGMFSSQNEQDNRNYAKMAKIPLLEPSDSQECHDMIRAAFELSEQYDTVVMVRMVTRVCHSKSLVEVGERKELPAKEWKKDPQKYVALPAFYRARRRKVEERQNRLAAYSSQSPFNHAEYHGKKIGVIASGPSFWYAKEVFGEDASFLKLGFTNPMPEDLIREFCEKVETVFVIEEDDLYIEECCQRLGLRVHGKDTFPPCGEMTPDVLKKSLAAETAPEESRSAAAGIVRQAEADAAAAQTYENDRVIRRPPTFCAGCPHRGLFYRLGKRKDIMISGDIGCYTLAAGEPYNAMDSVVCMGASISVGHGAQKAFEKSGVKKKVVTVIGDSTFFHTGINSLINTVYNNSNTINIILDNRITAMTGHQQNPGTGYNAKGEPAPEIDLVKLVEAVGIRHVRVINPNNLAEVDEALDAFMDLDEPSVIITRWPCVLKKLSQQDNEEFPQVFLSKNVVDQEKCIGCRSCLKTGCPALIYDKKAKKVSIRSSDCVGCDVCAQVCKAGAISKEENR